MVSAKQLADYFGLDLIGHSEEISHVAMSAEAVVPGALFIAVQGDRSHGIEFLDQAIKKGAVAVLTDSGHAQLSSIATIIHPDPREIAGAISARILSEPAKALQLFGVTGTNGKTSTATYLHRILQLCGIESGLSASTGRFGPKGFLPSLLTSPEATELHELLASFRKQGANAAVIEVSAQALVRNRVDAVGFDVVGFTNLSRDHLDDFGSMQNYLGAKAKLFAPEVAKLGVVFAEDGFARELANSALIPIVTVGGADADWVYAIDEEGEFSLSDSKTLLKVKFHHGALMAKNFALAVVMAISSGVGVEKLKAVLDEFEFQVPGRLERVSPHYPAIFVDYAHTPEGVLSAVAELRGRFDSLTLILGASGNRDVGKRELMGKNCATADLLIITDQHPRDEEPASIRKALMSGALQVLPPEKIFEIPDPQGALQLALAKTLKSGAILWCGPGNLTYREIRGQKVPFNARLLAKDLVEND